MQLFEKYRPKSISAVVGQSATVDSLNMLLKRGFNSGALYFVGASGTGKTTLAKALCADLQIDASDLTEIGGADCDVEFVRDTVQNFALSTWGASGWKAVIVDEAHAMTPRAVQAWLPFLESLPRKRLVIFTSTEALDSDMFGNFTGPMASRCKVFQLEADTEAFAAHVAKIAGDENLNGQPLEAYRQLIAGCKNNLRAALQRVETGEMLRTQALKLNIPGTNSLKASCASGVASYASGIASAASAVASRASGTASCASGIASGDLEARISAEVAFGAKFLPGSPKFKAHKERLAELESQRPKPQRKPAAQSATLSEPVADAIAAIKTLQGCTGREARKMVDVAQATLGNMVDASDLVTAALGVKELAK